MFKLTSLSIIALTLVSLGILGLIYFPAGSAGLAAAPANSAAKDIPGPAGTTASAASESALPEPDTELTEIDSEGPQAAVALPDAPGLPLFDFVDGEPAWFTVNDDVMGGISQSTVSVTAAGNLLTFQGNVSLENNGGFASIRSAWQAYDLRDYAGIRLRVRGDGNDYRLRIYTEPTGRDIAYTAIFSTEPGLWTEAYIPFAEMVPLFRGFLVERAGPLQPDQIRSISLMITDKQVGEFELEVDWIRAE